MLLSIAPDIWHVPHYFVVNCVPVSSRMTVVRLKSGGLWLHSPVPLAGGLREQLEALGRVEYIVAPSKTHHLFVAECCKAFPDAKLFGAPGLAKKRPDLAGMRELTAEAEPQWRTDLEQQFFAGIPFANETTWLHKPSGTLILTDLAQWWSGELPLAARIYARLTGVRDQLGVPRTVRGLVRDRQSAHASAQKILQWRFERVITAHNVIIEENAHAAVTRAFAAFAAS